MKRAEAEKDRQCVVMALRHVSATAQFDVAADALKQLREGRTLPSCDAPGSASADTSLDVGKVSGMNKVQLRALAIQLPGISRNRKTSAGKWIPKTCQELRQELSALKAHVLKRPAAFKRPAFALA